MTRELSSYAFNEYGGDAGLYNAIHDLETVCSTLRVALERNRQGLLNLLELRKLAGEGYGDRYGALTREEIETAIAGIDSALSTMGTPDLSEVEPILRVPIVSAGQLVIMTCATFDSMIRVIETTDVPVSIEKPDKASCEEFNRAVAIAAAADPEARVHDLLKLTLEGEV